MHVASGQSRLPLIVVCAALALALFAAPTAYGEGFTRTGDLNVPRAHTTNVKLADGRVLVAGGETTGGDRRSSGVECRELGTVGDTIDHAREIEEEGDAESDDQPPGEKERVDEGREVVAARSGAHEQQGGQRNARVKATLATLWLLGAVGVEPRPEGKS